MTGWHIGFRNLWFPLLVLALVTGCAGNKPMLKQMKTDNWVCVYNEDAAPRDIAQFDVAVLDADAHPDLDALSAARTLKLGYVSLCEAGDYRWFWPEIAERNWVVGRNPEWGGYLIDVRSREWQNLLLDHIVPKILNQGFDGLFLDTVDTAEYLEKYHPQVKRAGMMAAVVELIRAIRVRFPGVVIVMNRGYAVLEQVVAAIDGVVAESIFTTTAETGLRFRTPAEMQAELELLKRMHKRHGITVFSLDYFDAALESEVETLILRARSAGFVPYVSTRELDKIYFYALTSKDDQDMRR